MTNSTAHDPRLLSIVIDNFNYARFLKSAIDSALQQSWENVEVIVVDDGSTDNSREIIESYGDQITSVFKENGGQHSAVNAGVERVNGDVTIILDADDTIDTDTGARVMHLFKQYNDIARVQWPLRVVDRDGKPTGALNPKPSILVSGDLRDHIIRYRTHAWPPTSGNAHKTSVLKQLHPIPDTYARAIDRYYSDTTPLFGSVVSLSEPGGAYHIHGSNMYTGSELRVDRIRDQINLTLANHEDVKRVCKQMDVECPADAREARDVAFCCQRLASLRLEPAKHPISTDRRTPLAFSAIRAAVAHPHHTLAHKAKRIAWILGVAFGPMSTARTLIKRFYFNSPS